MHQYQTLLRHVFSHGTDKSDRTGTGTRSVFGYQMRFDLSDGFPLLTTKKLHLRSIIHELLWFLRGDTNIQYLKDHQVSIWDEWADENGDLGPVYGYQWRSWQAPNGQSIDQISNIIQQIKKQSRQPPPDCVCMESCSSGRYGIAAMPRAVSILCGRWQIILSIIST